MRHKRLSETGSSFTHKNKADIGILAAGIVLEIVGSATDTEPVAVVGMGALAVATVMGLKHMLDEAAGPGNKMDHEPEQAWPHEDEWHN